MKQTAQKSRKKTPAKVERGDTLTIKVTIQGLTMEATGDLGDIETTIRGVFNNVGDAIAKAAVSAGVTTQEGVKRYTAGR